MEKSISSKGKTAPSGAPVLKALITGAAVFALCVLLLPLLLLKSADPASFASAASAATVAITALASSFSASRSSSGHFLLAALICAAVICVLLFVSALIFSGSSETDYIFSGIIYGTAAVFSLIGAWLGRKKSGKKSRKRRR